MDLCGLAVSIIMDWFLRKIKLTHVANYQVVNVIEWNVRRDDVQIGRKYVFAFAKPMSKFCSKYDAFIYLKAKKCSTFSIDRGKRVELKGHDMGLNHFGGRLSFKRECFLCKCAIKASLCMAVAAVSLRPSLECTKSFLSGYQNCWRRWNLYLRNMKKFF